jgi:hypothetical protein
VRDTLSMTPANRLDQLREVQVRDVDADTLVRLDLVKQVSALGQLERKPYPRGVLAVMDESYDVGVVLQAFVQRDFQLDLSGLQTADLEGMLFVYEFDRDDGTGCVWGNGFADAVGIANGISQSCRNELVCRKGREDVRGVGAGADGLGYDAKGKVGG